jgi:methionyl-tRNA formyltransferase
MKKTLETIVFFGSGPVAAKSLELLNESFNIEAVITKPAKTRRRDPVPVIDVCKKLGLPLFLPTNRKELDELMITKPVDSKLAVLIDYGIIVSLQVIDYFPLGIINSHFSLLPKWRGADPITFSILSGDKQTGVSLMMLTAGMDEGPILDISVVNINNSTYSVKLTEELILASNALLIKNIPKYINGQISPVDQNTDLSPTYSKKLQKQDGEIDWNKSAVVLEREIRAYISWPKSYTLLNNLNIIITEVIVENKNGKPGTFTLENNELVFYCGKKALSIKKLKPAGKNEMEIKSFLSGYSNLFK